MKKNKSPYTVLKLYNHSLHFNDPVQNFMGHCQHIYKQEKACGLKVQPLKDIILGSSPSVNRKLVTHILTNIPTHTHRHQTWVVTISSAYD